ncbi:ABC transporter ATP-binding protein [Candidatus Bathyarchaeota archaeon]|nr:MAG: ABC transporter ATP-binding protein [Candidatus Bathyarchaeota archaeon]
MVKVVLKGITKRFGDVVAAGNVNLEIKDGEFFTLLGPSGCGKTTTLRIIAGLEQPDEGRVYFGDRDVTDLPPYKRNTGMVFQNYALWPHMSVFDNIAYGLKVRKVPKEEIKERVQRVLDLVKLRGLERRFPSQLSGGQQQRVALARVLVVEPEVLLLDEPLSNLDAKLRIEMREEIKDLQRRLKITTIYVTHDQEEAMVISDRVAIQNKGVIHQVGDPGEVYNRPKDLFVATFIGRGTLLEGIVEREEEPARIRVGDLIFQGRFSSDHKKVKRGDKVACVLRPENFSLEKPKGPSNLFEGVVEWTAFVGPYTEVRVSVGGNKILIDVPPDVKVSVGERIRVYIPQEDTIILPLEESP